jgi:hypothetical protein
MLPGPKTAHGKRSEARHSPLDHLAGEGRIRRIPVVIPRAISGVLALVTLFGCDLETRGRILWGEADATTPEGGLLPIAGARVVVLSGQTTEQLGGDGGEPSTDICPMGQSVIGFQGEQLPDDAGLIVVICQIRASCGTLAVDPSGNVTVTATSTLPEHGTSTGPSWTQS